MGGQRTRTALVATLLALGASCASGSVYTHTVTPLDGDFNATPVMQKGGSGNVKQVTYSNVEFEWGVNGIGEISKLSDFEEIYYADFELLSVLGIWTQTWVHVYGR